MISHFLPSGLFYPKMKMGEGIYGGLLEGIILEGIYIRGDYALWLWVFRAEPVEALIE